jgi:hypothetical protein
MIQDKIFFDEKDPTGVSYNTPFTVYGSYQGRLWSKTPTGSIKFYTQNSDLSVYATTGSNQFSGSQTVTGSLTVTGGITGSVTTASYVEYTGVANKPALVSGSSQVTYSGLTGVPAGIVSSSTQIGGYGVFATTGSNQFNGSQAITGSLTVTGQVVAQTLNVQQVTSSIVYSSGSNIFGNSLSNTQQFTGSVFVTGSLTVGGVTNVGTRSGGSIRNLNIYGATNSNAIIKIDGADGNGYGAQIDFVSKQTGGTSNTWTLGTGINGGTNAFELYNGSSTSLSINLSGSVGIGSLNPNEKLEVQDGYLSTYHNLNSNDAGYGIQFYTNGGGSKNSLAAITLSQVGTARSGNLLFQTSNAGAPSTKMTITSDGKIGIGAPSPSSLLEVAGGGIFSLQLSGNLTNSTRKFAFIQGKHYTNSVEPIAMIGIDSQASTSTLYIGGGLTSGLNAVTAISFQTGATNTTLTGTERMIITSAGNVGIGTATPTTYSLNGRHFELNDAGGGYSFIHNNTTTVKSFYAINESALLAALFTFSNHPLTLGTNNTERMRINSSGVVLINNTYASPSGVLNTFKTPVSSTYVDQIVVQGTGNYPSLRLGTYDAYDGVIATTGNDLRILAGLDVSTEDHNIRFYTSFIGGTGGAQAYERMRITSGGYLKASNTGTYVGSTGPYHEIIAGGNDSDLLFTRHTAASPYGIEINFSGASPNNTTNWFTYYYDTTNVKFIVYSNGNVVNRNGSYGTISDIKYKENIVDATPKLDDILKLQVRNFNLIGDNKKQIGFIAQEFEEVFPSMVDISIDKNTEEEYKSIKTTVLIPMLVKAIQELKSENDTLKSILQRNNIS